MQKDLLIYIPGLGSEDLIGIQEKLLRRWNSKNIEVIVLQPKWHTDKDEAYPQKKDRLITEIKSQIKNYKSASIFGSSAGGSLALNIFNEMKSELTSCVLISSKLKRAEALGQSYRRRAPALYDSVKASALTAANPPEDLVKRILVLKPLLDEVVSTSDMTVNGAKTKTMLFIGHTIGIGGSLIFKKRTITRWHNKLV